MRFLNYKNVKMHAFAHLKKVIAAEALFYYCKKTN